MQIWGIVLQSYISCASFLAGEEIEINEALVKTAKQKIIPLVEKETGTKLEGLVSAKLVEPFDMQQKLVEELTLQFVNYYPDKKSAKLAAQQQSTMLHRSFLAKFAPKEKELWICQKNFDYLSDLLDAPEILSEQVFYAVLVHEAVHAADEEKYHFSTVLNSIKSPEASRAYSAVLEGHAQHVARRICEKNGWKEGLEQFAAAIGKRVEAKDQVTQVLMDGMSAAISSPYSDGEEFIKCIDKKGGEAAIAKAFASPELELNTIFHPDWFLDPSAQPKNPYPLDQGLEALGTGFEEETWGRRQFTMIAPQWEIAFSFLPRSDAKRLIQGVHENKGISFFPKANPASKLVYGLTTKFFTDEDAQFYLEASDRLLKVKSEKMKEGVNRILSVTSEGVLGKSWKGYAYKVVMQSGADKIEVNSLVAIRGPIGIELLYSGEAVTREAIVAAASRVFDRLFLDAK